MVVFRFTEQSVIVSSDTVTKKRGLRFPDNSFVDRTLPVNLCKISKYPGIPYCFMRILAEFDGGFSGCEG